jgi:hypothetical protein
MMKEDKDAITVCRNRIIMNGDGVTECVQYATTYYFFSTVTARQLTINAGVLYHMKDVLPSLQVYMTKQKFSPEVCRHCELLHFCWWAQVQSMPTVTEAESSCYPVIQHFLHVSDHSYQYCTIQGFKIIVNTQTTYKNKNVDWNQLKEYHVI